MEIKQYKVKDGIATAINPYINEQKGPFNIVRCDEVAQYAHFDESNYTYSCNAPDGVYDADRFEHLVWQLLEGDGWVNCSYEDYSYFYRQSDSRIFLPFKLSPENKQEFGDCPSDEYLKSLKFHEKYFSNQYWYPSEEDRKYMSENAFNEAIEEYNHADKLVLLDGFRVEFHSCDCGSEYGCSHGAWPFELHHEFGKGADMQWEDEGLFIESPKGVVRFNKTDDTTMYHFVKACELLDLKLTFNITT